MSQVSIRMKNKQLTKMALDTSGAFKLSGYKTTSDVASKGLQSQPANPLTTEETTGLHGPLPSQTSSTMTGEAGTTGSTERVAPMTKKEADKQPEMKELESSPSQSVRTAADTSTSPTSGTPAKAPHQAVPSATAKNVWKTPAVKNATNDAGASTAGAQPVEKKKAGKDASTSVGGKLES